MAEIRPVEAPNIERAKYLAEKRELDKLKLIGTLVLLLFIPYIAILPLVVFSIYRRDRKDFEDPYRFKWHKSELWKLMYVVLWAEAFYFLIFPLVPKSLPIWGIYASLSIPNYMVSVVVFAVLFGLSVYLTKRKIKPWFEMVYHPYRDLVGRKDYIIVPTREHGTIILKRLNTGIMVLGAPGSGKTEFIKQLVVQLPSDEDTAWIIFDPKGDYLKEFGDRKVDVVLSLDPKEATYTWNIFREVAPREPLKSLEETEDKVERYFEMRKKHPEMSSQEIWAMIDQGAGRDEDPMIAISQIMGEMFKEMTETSQDKFWNYAAQQVLEGFVYVMYKEALKIYKEAYERWEEYKDKGMPDEWKKEMRKLIDELDMADTEEEKEEIKKKILEMKNQIPKKPDFYEYLPTNADLYDNITQMSYVDAYKMFQKYPELSMVASYLNPKAEKMAGSVWAVLGTQFKRIFQGTFGPHARGLKQISMKEYMRNPNGRKLFIEYDVSKGEVLGPVYRVLIDRLIEYGFERGSEERVKYFVIDEFQNVPKLTLYQNLVNYGRSYNMTSIIGIQALTQVDRTYGQETTNSVIAGHRFIFAFSLGDEKSRKFVEEELGKRTMWVMRPMQVASENPKGGHRTIGAEYSKVEVQRYDTGNIRFWKPGEVLIIAREGALKTRLYTYREALPRILRVQRDIKKLKRWIWRQKRNHRRSIFTKTATA